MRAAMRLVLRSTCAAMRSAVADRLAQRSMLRSTDCAGAVTDRGDRDERDDSQWGTEVHGICPGARRDERLVEQAELALEGLVEPLGEKLAAGSRDNADCLGDGRVDRLMLASRMAMVAGSRSSAWR
jgi:hypothetical protein